VFEVIAEEVVSLLYTHRNPRNIVGMRRYGIVSKAEILGVPKPILREIARKIGSNHKLAIRLWSTGIHEARILASMIADPERLDEEAMDLWVKDIDNWDLCDQCVLNLFWKAKYAVKKAVEWSIRNEEFVRRAGIVLMARLAWMDRRLPDKIFIEFLDILRKIIRDNRRYVWKAIVWALKKIGLRNTRLRKLMMDFCSMIKAINPRIANNVLNYLSRKPL